MLGEQLTVSGTGELGSTIRVDDEVLRVATLVKCHAQSGNNQWGIEKLVHRPTDHSPAKDIQDRNKVQPTLTGEHAGGVGRPDLVRPSLDKLLHSFGCDRISIASVCSCLPILGKMSIVVAL